MKALKSPLAKVVLADPRSRDQLRSYLARKSSPVDPGGAGDAAGAPDHEPLIEVRRNGRVLRLRPVTVPKAA